MSVAQNGSGVFCLLLSLPVRPQRAHVVITVSDDGTERLRKVTIQEGLGRIDLLLRMSMKRDPDAGLGSAAVVMIPFLSTVTHSEPGFHASIFLGL
ncbi:hypothetical protein R1flu_019915 [Riccia fluitans]|uniref:Uncharacterized protein n=1 Tax=Riccia fluitans TaxID=41844 RepID=A0ABD1ZL36_9MARC